MVSLGGERMVSLGGERMVSLGLAEGSGTVAGPLWPLPPHTPTTHRAEDDVDPSQYPRTFVKRCGEALGWEPGAALTAGER